MQCSNLNLLAKYFVRSIKYMSDPLNKPPIYEKAEQFNWNPPILLKTAQRKLGEGF